jgi:HK97 family phage prohead protease
MKQTRFIPIENCGLQLRESADGQPSRTVVGRPIMFGVRSVNLTPWSDTRVVYEILEPGCITQELINRSDVVYNNNHSNDIANMIGRCRNGKGTLTLALREQYVESECDYPNTTVANDTLEQIRLGNVYGMSFAFEDDWQDTENGVSYERTNETVDGKEVWLRHVKKIVALYDVANVTHPAYEQTSVGTREQSDRINEAIDAQLKRECGGGDDDEAKKKAEEEAKKKADEEAKAKEEQEARELAEREQKEREAVAVMRMRRNRLALQNRDIETFSY